MLDESIDEIRDFVNSHKTKSNEAHSKNGTAECPEERHEETKSRTEKTAGDNLGTQRSFNLLTVTKNSVVGLTFEIREGLYSKLNCALSVNFQNTISKENKTSLTKLNICDIAKKVEFSIFSTAKDLNSYKLSGTGMVVKIEKQTRNLTLCEILSAEIELLKLRAEMRTSINEDDPQQQSGLLLSEAKSISHEKEIQSQSDQSNTEPMTDDTRARESAVDVAIAQETSTNESEYFSCSPMEIQKNNESCTLNSNSQDPVLNTLAKKKLGNLESTKDNERSAQSTLARKISLTCNSKNDVIEKTNELNNDSIEILSSNEAQIDLPSADGVSLKKKRKRQPTLKSPSDNHSPIQHNKVNADFLKESNVVSGNCAKDSPPKKKLKESENEMDLNTSDITIVFTQTLNANNNNDKTCETQLKDCSQIKLEKNQDNDINVKRADVNVPNKTQQIENINRLITIKDEPDSPPLIDSLSSCFTEKEISLTRNTIKEELDEKCYLFDRKENIMSPNGKSKLQTRIKQSPGKSVNILRNVKCRIKHEIDISSYSISVDNKENIDKIISESLALEAENISLTDKNFSNAQEDNTVSQNSELNLENDGVLSMDTSTCSEKNTGITASEENSAPGVDTSSVTHESNVRKITCLIDEEAFDLERARLDKEYEKLKNRAKEQLPEESKTDIYIHGDYKHIFEIIVPIMKEYYPSNYIPDELCYGKILQRLQIDLAEAEMSNEDIACYTRDSVKTMRYLCDHCIVQ